MPKSDNEIKITDKRKFDKDGNIKETKKGTVKIVKEAPSVEKIKVGQSDVDSKENIRKSFEDLVEGIESQKGIDFIQFVLSLYTSVLATIGEITDPSTKIEKNPEQAKELIDIISMLKDKTKGNLTQDEQNVIDEVIYQCKMIFLKNTGGLKL